MLPAVDRVRLRHMLDAAEKAVRLSSGRAWADLQNDDDPLADALVRLLSVIGEAAHKVSDETRSMLEAVPWSDVIGMRHRLIHDYFDINLGIVWATVQDDLPALIERLAPALDQDEEAR